MEEHRLYATDYSKTNLDWVGDRLTGIASADVIVISRNDADFASDLSWLMTDTGPLSPEDALNTLKTSMSATFNSMGVPSEYVEKILENEALVAELFTRLVQQSPAAVGIDLDGDAVNDFGIIIPPSYDSTNADLLSALAVVSQEDLINIPAGKMEGLAFVMFHEAGHIPQTRTDHVLFREIDADRVAMLNYQRAVDKGLVDQNFIDALIAARTAGSLNASGGYETALQLMLTGHKDQIAANILPTHSTHVGLEADTPVLPTQNVNSIPAGSELPGVLSTNLIAKTVLGMTKVREMIEENADYDGITLRGDAIYFGDENADGSFDSWFKDPSDLVLAFTDMEKIIGVGQFFAAGNPAEAYATIKALQELGLFKNEALASDREYIESLDVFFSTYYEGIDTDPEFIAQKQAVFGLLKEVGIENLTNLNPQTDQNYQADLSKEGYTLVPN